METKFILYCLDVETTNLSHLTGDIIELSIYRLSDDSQKTWFIKPKNYDAIEPDALRINGHKLEDLKLLTKYGQETYQDPAKVIVEIENWMLEDMGSTDDRILIGQNPIFDLQFMQKLWDENNCKETFPLGKRPFVLDTRQVQLFIDLVNNTRQEYYNLGSLVERWGVKKEKAHRADADTRMTKDVLLAQLAYIKDIVQM
jgi:DNA polymerase III epsilon subunit-like protein